METVGAPAVGAGAGEAGEAGEASGRWWGVAAVAVGIALCLVQYFANVSYWVDELAVVRNLADRNLGALLTRPLDYDQVAPSGFLLAQHALERAFGSGELVLRAYALVMACIALAAVLHLGRRLLPYPAALVPVLLLGTSGQLHWLASQVKPYSGDVAMMAVVLALALSAPRWPERAVLRRFALLIGAVAPWFAQPVLFAIPSLMVAASWSDLAARRRPSGRTVGAVLLLGTSALGALVAARARVDPAMMSFMRQFWRDGFVPIPPSSMNDLKWPAYVVRMLVADLTNQRWSYVYLLIAVVGLGYLWRRARRDTVLLLLPIPLAFIASALRQYPLADRLAFCLVPIVAVLIGAGFAAIMRWWVRRSHASAWAATLAFIVPSVYGLLRNPPPYESQPVRELFAVIRDEMQPGDRAFVHYGSWQAWMHYAPRLGVGALPVVLGGCHADAPREYDAEIRALQGGGRTWILFVRAGGRNDPAQVERVADSLGRRLLSMERLGRVVEGAPNAVNLLLYDFGAGGSVSPTLIVGDSSPPPLPPTPPDASCRGAAVPRRTG